MRRFRSRPFGDAVRPLRLVSMLMAIVVLWMLFGRFKDPATWRGLLDIKDDAAVAVPPTPLTNDPAEESIVPGPNDLDSDEFSKAQEMFQLVKDRSPLKPREMHAYWRMMAWSHTTPVAELQRRALRDVPITQLWEQPGQYRGKPISLRLHVRRVLKFDAPQNPDRRPVTYEAWGWTDESRSFPYVVVFSECPTGLPVGTDVRSEIEFVGYFLKVMSYTAFDKRLSAPLLVGRVQIPVTLATPAKSPAEPTLLIWVILAGIVVAGFGFWTQPGSRTGVRRVQLPAEFTPVESLSLPVSTAEETVSDDSELIAAESGARPVTH